MHIHTRTANTHTHTHVPTLSPAHVCTKVRTHTHICSCMHSTMTPLGVMELTLQPLSRAGVARPRLPAQTRARLGSHAAGSIFYRGLCPLASWVPGEVSTQTAEGADGRAVGTCFRMLTAPFWSWQPALWECSLQINSRVCWSRLLWQLKTGDLQMPITRPG